MDENKGIAKVISLTEMIITDEVSNNQKFKEMYQYKLAMLVHEAFHDPLNKTTETGQHVRILNAMLVLIEEGKTNDLLAITISSFPDVNFQY